MYGLEAISKYNGWAMAMAGAIIVFSGLVVLSAVISQLHKVLDFFEKLFNRVKAGNPPPSAEVAVDPAGAAPSVKNERFPNNLDHLANQYKSISEPLGDAFPLAELYRLARKGDIPHPHLAISYLRQYNFLIPQGDGIFSWR